MISFIAGFLLGLLLYKDIMWVYGKLKWRRAENKRLAKIKALEALIDADSDQK